MLQEIVGRKREELSETKVRCPLPVLLPQVPQELPPSFRAAVTQSGINVIAEIKYRSPSRGRFNCTLGHVDLAMLYSENGAAAVSVLTEKTYFEGDLDFLAEIHAQREDLPLLRKDFIVDRYQVVESRVKGASACLLIVACLSESELSELLSAAEDLQLDALVEIHDAFELEVAIENGARIIGVNNRDLRTFRVDLNTSFDIARRMEGERDHILISESGIDQPGQIAELRDAGFSAFLVGASLMGSSDPGERLRELRGEG